MQVACACVRQGFVNSLLIELRMSEDVLHPFQAHSAIMQRLPETDKGARVRLAITYVCLGWWAVSRVHCRHCRQRNPS